MDQDLRKLLKPYALTGIAQWNGANKLSKDIARLALRNRIAETEYEAGRAIDAKLKDGADERARFIPMPMVNHSDILHCFFLPTSDGEKMGFDLMLIIGTDQSLGFRFEPPDPPDSTHGYGHVQMNRSMFRKNIEANGIPQWLPDRYPAFPIRSSQPLQIFLSMAASIHGYEKGMKQMVSQLFANEPITAKKYLSALEAALI
jgi:hypothetical protein